MYKLKSYRNYTRLFIIGLLLAIIPNAYIESATLSKNIYSYPADPIPEIDGILSDGEWTAAGTPEQTKLYDLSDQYNPHIMVNIRSVYTNNSDLYLAFEIPDTLVDRSDYFIIVFNTSDTPLALNAISFGISFDDDHDAKVLYIFSNIYTDSSTDGISYNTRDDVSTGGTYDGEAKSTSNATHVIIEFKIPLNSGDLPGYDLNLNFGEDEEIFLVYFDGDNETIYSHWLVETNDYEYCRIHIDNTLFLSIPLWIFTISLTSIFIIATIIKKRKKS